MILRSILPYIFIIFFKLKALCVCGCEIYVNRTENILSFVYIQCISSKKIKILCNLQCRYQLLLEHPGNIGSSYRWGCDIGFLSGNNLLRFSYMQPLFTVISQEKETETKERKKFELFPE